MAIILIVEDEALIGEVAKMTIADLGHNTLSASDMDEALLHLRAAQPINALFTDIRLKAAVLGGYELADQARNLRPQLRVLYASGNPLTDQARALFVNGGHFVQKPYSPAQLTRAIENLLLAPEPATRSTPSP